MKNVLRCLTKTILIGVVVGQGFPNRQFVEGPAPLPYFGNRPGFYPGNPMPVFPRPPQPPPFMYRDEGLQTPSILYRNDFSVQPAPPFYRTHNMPPPTPLYREEGMQPVPGYYHEKGVQQGPNMCREDSPPPCPTLYRESGFRPVAGLFRDETMQPGLFLYRGKGLQQEQPFYRDEHQPSYEAELSQPEPCLPDSSEKPSSHSSLPNRHNSKLIPSKCSSSKGNDINCQSSAVSPLKMNIEPSKENFNTLRTALRMPIEEPPSISQKNEVLPTIIIEEAVPNIVNQHDNNKGYLEDDYSDSENDDERLTSPEPTIINYPYQFFEPIKFCQNNGKIEAVAASKPCSSDVTDILPNWRSPITILPSRFPPRVEQIIERIQTYFSTYNHQGNQKPVTPSTSIPSLTASTSVPDSGIFTTPTTSKTTIIATTFPPTYVTTTPYKIPETSELETSSESNVRIPIKQQIPTALHTHYQTAEPAEVKVTEKTTTSVIPISTSQNQSNSGSEKSESSEKTEFTMQIPVLPSHGQDSNSTITDDKNTTDYQKKNGTEKTNCENCQEEISTDQNGCNDCKDKETESSTKESCDECEKE